MGSDLDLLISGLVIGFSVAAPVGPITMLCINGMIGFTRMFCKDFFPSPYDSRSK